MRILTRLKPALAALFAWGALCTPAAAQSSLEISPVFVTLVAGQTVEVIEMRNRGGSAVAIQIRAFDWSQSGDVDILEPTRDLILSPPIFTIPAGAAQTIRLLLRAGDAGGERSYRLLVDEVPSPGARNNQVSVALRVSLPVIAAATVPPARSLTWRASRSPDGQLTLSAVNAGNVYDKVHAIVVTLPDGSQPKIVPRGDNPYLLPGAEREWIVRDAVAPASLQLNVTTQAGASEHLLVVGP